LRTERLGPLPLVNHFLARLGLEALLDKHVPTQDRRVGCPYAHALGVLLRSIVVEREPIYRQQETVRAFAPATYGLDAETVERLGDDPDLKQLLLCLTTSADGGVPVQFRCADGNTNDATTHIETWQALRAVAGKADFLYVADSKLCTRENMDHIDQRGGRLVTVLPRSRLEDAEFRKWVQGHTPATTSRSAS
jgi:hypothetical protein